MTISNDNNKNGPYSGNGVTTRFERTFRVKNASELHVYETTLGITTEVTTGITKEDLTLDVGDVVFATAPPTGTNIMVIREKLFVQETDYSAQGKVPPVQVEDDVDETVMLMQDINERVSRSISVDIASDDPDTFVPEANTLLGFDALKQPFASAGTGGVPTSPFMATFVQATTGWEGRDVLDVDARVLSKSAAYTAVAGDRSKLIRGTATMTLSLEAAADLGDGWFIDVYASAGTLTIDPDAAETINGIATLEMRSGHSTRVSCDGTSFHAHLLGAPKVYDDYAAFAASTEGSRGVGAIWEVRSPAGFDAYEEAPTAATDHDLPIGGGASSGGVKWYVKTLASPSILKTRTGNVRKFGAGHGDTAEDTLAFQAAIDYVAIASLGGVVEVPENEYFINDDLVFPAGSSVSLKGEGRNTSYVNTGLTGFDLTKKMFRFDGTGGSPCEQVTIADLTLRARYFGYGIFAANCFPKLVIRDVDVQIPGSYGVYLDDCWTAALYSVEVDGQNSTDSYGIYVNNANDVTLYNPRIYNMKNSVPSTAIKATSCENFNIYGGDIENCPRGVHVALGGAFGGPVLISGIYFEPRGMSAFDAGQPNDHILIEGAASGEGTVTVEANLFQAGNDPANIAYNAVTARNLGVLNLRGNTWQKAKYTAGGEGENYFVDADSTVLKVIETGNYLVSTALGDLRNVNAAVINSIDNIHGNGDTEKSSGHAAFLAVNSSGSTNVTGDGTAVTVGFDSEIFDRGSNYDNTTDTFTAPNDGYYSFSATVRIEGLAAAGTLGQGKLELVTSNATYLIENVNVENVKASDDKYSFNGTVLAEMEAGDTAYMRLTVSGGTKVVDITGVNRITSFSGHLVI